MNNKTTNKKRHSNNLAIILTIDSHKNDTFQLTDRDIIILKSLS